MTVGEAAAIVGSEPAVVTSEARAKVQHWKHGWIPLTAEAAIKKFGAEGAVRYLRDEARHLPGKHDQDSHGGEGGTELPNFLKKAKKIEKPRHGEAFKNANPDYSTSRVETTVNCTKVVAAYELRRRGFDVEAGLGEAGLRPHEWIKFWKIKDGSAPATLQATDRAGLEAEMKKAPVGARFAVTGVWKAAPGKQRSAHVWSAEVMKDGSILYFDAQMGRPTVSAYYSRIDGQVSKGIRAFRLDNAEPTEELAKLLKGS
jgi:hypothetical protein